MQEEYENSGITQSDESGLNLKEFNFEYIKEKIAEAKELLNKDEILINDISKMCSELLQFPVVEQLCEKKIITVQDFEIAEDSNLNPVFIRNLLNVCSIVNYAWCASKENIESFHSILLNANIMFSYIFRNEIDLNSGIDYILLAPLSNVIYSYIAQKGLEFINKEDYNFDQGYFGFSTQIGNTYQENTNSQLLAIFGDKDICFCPRIMYYLNRKTSLKLFTANIIDVPSEYLNLKYIESSKKYHGYNEVDCSFFLLEEKRIKQNNSFNVVKTIGSGKTNENFEMINSKDIIFPKNTNIFIETKYSLNNIDINKELKLFKTKGKRFSTSYKNTAYSKIKPIFSKTNNFYVFLYDQNRNSINRQNINEDIAKDINIIFNSVTTQISTVVILQNSIREMNEKINILSIELNTTGKELMQTKDKLKETEKKLEETEKKLEETEKKLEETENKVESHESELIKTKEILNKIEDKIMLKFFVEKMNEKSIENRETVSIIQRYIDSKDIKLFDIFSNLAKDYDICSKYFVQSSKEKEIEVYTSFNQFIGKYLYDGKDKEKYITFLGLLEQKIKEESETSKFYKALKFCLIGEKNPSDIDNFDIFSQDGKSCDILKSFAKFICFLEKYPNFREYFYRTILYYFYVIHKGFSKKGNEFYSGYFKEKSVEDFIINLIKSVKRDDN